MDWTAYTGQQFDDKELYLFHYLDKLGAERYDVGKCRNGKPFVVGNFFDHDIVEEILAFIKIEQR